MSIYKKEIAKVKITVYSTNSCGACDYTKKWLDEHGVDYTPIENADEDPEIMQQMKNYGYMGFPVVTIENWDNGWSGINLKRLEELLKED